jgi:hypothetical protein
MLTGEPCGVKLCPRFVLTSRIAPSVLNLKFAVSSIRFAMSDSSSGKEGEFDGEETA